MSNPETRTTEDRRITFARQALAESKAATYQPPSNPKHWWGRLETVVSLLLEVIDERTDPTACVELLKALYEALDTPSRTADETEQDHRMRLMRRSAELRGVIAAALDHGDPASGAETIQRLIAEAVRP